MDFDARSLVWSGSTLYSAKVVERNPGHIKVDLPSLLCSVATSLSPLPIHLWRLGVWMNIFNSWQIWELQIDNKHVFHECILGLAAFAYFLVRWSCLHKTFTLSWCQGIPQQEHPDRPICRLRLTLLEWSWDQGTPGCGGTTTSIWYVCYYKEFASYLIDNILWWTIRQHQDCWYLQIKWNETW